MKIIIYCFAFLVSTPLFSQSKKELQAQVDQLKKESDQLKADIVLLKNPKEIELNDTLKRASYGLGTLLATNLRSQGGDSLNVEALVAGIEDTFIKKAPRMDQMEAMGIVQAYMQQAMQKKVSRDIEASAMFLANNKSLPGVTTTESGLQYKVISAGKGTRKPAATDKVTVHYTGKLIDGTVFDSSSGKEPVTFEVNGVIAGWTEALQLMHEGDKWEIYIPFPLGYGERGAGDQIPPYATLVFEVELIKIN